MGLLHHTVSRTLRRSVLPVSLLFYFLIAAASFAQNFTTSNKSVFASVQPGTGRIHIMIPPGRGLDPMLTFPNKSFFSCKINDEIYTNNDVGFLPIDGRGQPFMLNDGTVKKIGDTVRMTWTRSNVDIIQDVYPILFPTGGLIMMRWSFVSHKNVPIAISCQYLNDVDISDPADFARPDAQPNGNDGPIILHRYGYYRNWQQYINGQPPGIPDYYLAYLYDLPQTHPGLCAFGYLDNPSIGTIRPNRYTIGDWKQLSLLFWGVDPGWGYGSLSQPGKAITPGRDGGDVAELIEYAPIGAYPEKKVTAAATAYGTMNFPFCSGTLFAILKYPDKIEWDKTTSTYSPNPFQLEVLTVNGQQIFDPKSGLPGRFANNTFFTLTTGGNLNIVDVPPTYNLIGKSERLPKDPLGMTLSPGGVTPLNWYLKADPAYFCQGDVFSDLKLSGTSSLGDSTFVGDTCGHIAVVDCAETDYDPPLDSVYIGMDSLHKSIDVHDDRPTDRGLKSITWTPSNGTADSNFIISYSPAIRSCASDKDIHTVSIQQLDSTIGGCFDFTFEDCLGHQSYLNVCLKARPIIIIPDTLKPIISVVTMKGSYDGSICNARFDSLEILDNRTHDKGLEQVIIKPNTTPVNMTLNPNPLLISSGDLVARASIHIIDSMQDGTICIRATDKAGNSNDTCFTYCTIEDILKPRVEVSRNNAQHVWNITVKEDAPWDRLIDSIHIFNESNCAHLPFGTQPFGKTNYYFDEATIDSSAPSGFCLYAVDRAGNISDTMCYFKDAGADRLAPNISLDPDPKTSPTVVTVFIDDIHFDDAPFDTDTNRWDTGIDSVWFTNNFENKMIVPPTIHNFCLKEVPPFNIRVRDSLDIDSSACVTINAVDCQGNIMTYDWCFPYPLDIHPPVLFAKYISRDEIKVYATDSTTYDRGNQVISTSNEVNLTNYSANINKVPIDSFTLRRVIRGQSSFATLTSIDYWGSLVANRIPSHSAKIDIRISIQDLAMQKGIIAEQGQLFEIPVMFVANDSFNVASKSISDFAFSFTPAGDVNAISFAGIRTASTATDTWQVSAVPTGNAYFVEGHRPSGGGVLSKNGISDTLLVLQFLAKADAATRDVTLDIVPNSNETVVYNLGRDSLYSGLSSTALLPPPWGSLTGAHIVIAGSCAPALENNESPSVAMLDVPNPNPVSRSAVLHYTVPQDGFVKISVFDLLGRELITLVNQDQKRGSYQIVFDATDLSNGQYMIVLETSNQKQMRSVLVNK